MTSKLSSNLAKGSYFLGFMASLLSAGVVITLLIAMFRDSRPIKSGLARESLIPTLRFVILYASTEAVIGLLLGLGVVGRTTAHARKQALCGITLSSLAIVSTAVIVLFIFL